MSGGKERGYGKMHSVRGSNKTGYIPAHAQFTLKIQKYTITLAVFVVVTVCVFRPVFWVAPEKNRGESFLP
jgi:hypothetical protein